MQKQLAYAFEVVSAAVGFRAHAWLHGMHSCDSEASYCIAAMLERMPFFCRLVSTVDCQWGTSVYLLLAS